MNIDIDRFINSRFNQVCGRPVENVEDELYEPPDVVFAKYFSKISEIF